MNHTQQAEPAKFMDKNRNIIKGFLIGFLILLMLIPTSFIQNLVYEREIRQQDVISEISSKWANQQTITGPLIIVPYKTYTQSKDGKVMENIKSIYLLPEELNINTNASPEVRSRSLYDVTLYRSEMNISGSFNSAALKHLKLIPENILWKESQFVLGIDDARGLEEEVVLNWNKQPQHLEAGVPVNTILETGLSRTVDFSFDQTRNFSLNIKLKGSQSLNFTPVGKSTFVNMQSSWQHPAFDGQYLPVSQNVSDEGFKASWKVLQVSRNYPQAWIDGNYKIRESSFGVRLIQPADNYAKTERSVKYAFLFIALSFTVFFFMEIIQKHQVHPLQYLLVGFALCVFYTLLLSISEYTGFNLAYTVAAMATVILIGLYVQSIFKKSKIALGFAVALAGLYTYIFVLIQLQDYALLFGSIGLFCIIAILMFFSKKIDWYQVQQPAA